MDSGCGFAIATSKLRRDRGNRGFYKTMQVTSSRLFGDQGHRDRIERRRQLSGHRIFR